MLNLILSSFYSLISSVATFFKKDTIPFNNLPYDFKKRFVNLVPASKIEGFCKISPEISQLRCHRPECVDQVFITDDVAVYLSESIKIPFYLQFKLLYKYLQYFIDGACYFSVWYHSVLSVNKIIDKNRKLYVEHTLVLHCESIESYNKVIPYICGPYSRLVLDGNITWDQAKQLIHPKVQKIFIRATVEMEPEEYDDIVAFVKQQIHSFLFFFYLQSNVVPELNAKFSEAFKHHNTHRFTVFSLFPAIFVVCHRKCQWCWGVCWTAVMGFQLFITAFIGLQCPWYVYWLGFLFTSVVNVQSVSWYLRNQTYLHSH